MVWQQSYNDVHGWYRAHIKHLFGQLWHGGLVRNVWCGGPNELYQSVRFFVEFHATLHLEAIPSSFLWTTGPCSASCLDLSKRLGRHAR